MILKKRIIPYHFIKFQEKDFITFFNRIKECDGIACFDFEDGIKDLLVLNTKKFKHRQRKDVINLFKQKRDELDFNHIGLRLNSLSSEDFKDDVQVLKALKEIKPIKCLFLSKVKNISSITECLSELSDINFKEIIPVIECDQSFKDLDKITSIKNRKFNRIAFGHCDYNLSCEHFPFFHHDSEKYWNWIKSMERILKDSNKGFVNSPFLQLDNNDAFCQNLNKLSKYCQDAGQVTLCFIQTKLCSDFNVNSYYINKAITKQLPDPSDGNDYVDHKSLHNIEAYASKIVNDFEQSNESGKGFSIIGKNRVLISPQEYISAKKFLSGKR